MPRPIHKRILLPGEIARRPAVPTILVPRGHERQPTMVCTVPVNADGDTCGQPFYAGEERAFERHVGKCFAEHRDDVHEASPSTRLPILDEANWDPEVAAHMREVGKRMIEEGRLEVRPNERAGF